MFAIEVPTNILANLKLTYERPQHIAGLKIEDGRDISLTTAKFNTGLGEEETTIVARYKCNGTLQTELILFVKHRIVCHHLGFPEDTTEPS